MKTMIRKAAVLTSFIAAFATDSSSQITLTGELRPRFEYLHGFGAPADTLQKSARFIMQRTRLNFGYLTENFKTSIVLQDIRVWGNQSQLNLGDGGGSFGLHEAWGEYFFNKKVSTKIGRQEIFYDDERMMGAVNWAQQARSHDAFVFKYTDTLFNAHAGFAYNQTSASTIGTSYFLPKSYKEMQYLWLNKKIKSLNISFLVLNVGQQSPASIHSTRYVTTVGSHTAYNFKPLYTGFNFYYQTGDENGAGGRIRNVNAVNVSIDAAYTMNEKFSLGLGYEYLSGQSETDTSKTYRDINHAFSPVFGTNHKFNGLMDYYFVGNHSNSVGLQDIYLKLKYKSGKWNFGLDFHRFLTAADVLDGKHLAATGQYKAMNSSLGSEVDFTLGYNLPGGVALQAGYSHYFPTETLGIIKNVTDWKGDGRTDQISNWAYIMITFKPNFMKQ